MLKTAVLTFACFGYFLCSTTLGQESPIVNDAKDTRPFKAGDLVPDVTLQNVEGQKVHLASLYAKQPVVLVFFRGGWCPLCTKHTQELIKAYPEIKKMGAELVGISADNAEHTKDNVSKNSIPFPLLSDADVSVAKAFGLAFRVDDQTLARYQGFGIDLEKASGYNHHALPVPAVFIVDRRGKIAFAHSNPNYRERLDAKKIIEELRKLK